MPIQLLHTSQTLLVEGPCSVRVVEGGVECLGANVSPGKTVLIKDTRQLAFHALETALLDVIPRAEGAFRTIAEPSIPTSWNEAAQIINQSSPKIVVIVGDVDSGKSTLSTFLANELSKKMLKVAVVDADLGQADIGPPATVTGGRVNHSIIDLQELQGEHSFFIGDTSPSIVPEKVIGNISRLKDLMAMSADTVLVNTDGWVRDILAIHFKTELLSRIKPDLVVGLASNDEIDPLISNTGFASLKLDRSPFAKTRTKADRKKAREVGYRRFLQNSHLVQYDLDQITVRMFNDTKQTIFANSMKYRGLLTGLLDKNSEMINIGRLVRVRDDTLFVETCAPKKADILELGAIQLSSRYEETGYGLLH